MGEWKICYNNAVNYDNYNLSFLILPKSLLKIWICIIKFSVACMEPDSKKYSNDILFLNIYFTPRTESLRPNSKLVIIRMWKIDQNGDQRRDKYTQRRRKWILLHKIDEVIITTPSAYVWVHYSLIFRTLV